MRENLDPNKIDVRVYFAAVVTTVISIAVIFMWILSLIGMVLLLPKERWVIPYLKSNLRFYEYNNTFCKYVCYGTETCLHQAHTIRHRLAEYYCLETMLNKDLKEDFPDTKEEK